MVHAYLCRRRENDEPLKLSEWTRESLECADKTRMAH